MFKNDHLHDGRKDFVLFSFCDMNISMPFRVENYFLATFEMTEV